MERRASSALAPRACTAWSSVRARPGSESTTKITRSSGSSSALSSGTRSSTAITAAALASTASGLGAPLVRISGRSRARSRDGRNSEKRLPRPGSDSTWISPPSSRAISREIDSPRPVPPYFRDVVPSACWNASKIASSLSLGIPTPLSVTRNAITRSASSSPSLVNAVSVGAYPIDRLTPPLWVNLNAFDSRFLRIWPRRCSSETIDGGSSGSISTLKSSSFSSATWRNARSASS